MARTRRTDTSEFKAEAIKRITAQGDVDAEAARSLDINDYLIRNRKQALAAEVEQAFPGGGKVSPFEKDNRRLRREQAPPARTRPPKKNRGVLRQGGAMTFLFIDAHPDEWPVGLLCEGEGQGSRGGPRVRNRFRHLNGS